MTPFDDAPPSSAYGIQVDDLVRIHTQRTIYKVIGVSECHRYARLVSESSGRERLEAITNLNLVERP